MSYEGWKARDACNSCNAIIGYCGRYTNDGICPHCAYQSRGGICETHTVVTREVQLPSTWYKPWTWGKFDTEYLVTEIA